MTTTKPIITIHNQQTNEIISREMTEQEFLNYQNNLAMDAAEQENLKTVAKAKQQLLERLGITLDEAKLLLK